MTNPDNIIKPLHGMTAIDRVAKIAQARANARERRNRTRCFGTGACDCRHCRGR